MTSARYHNGSPSAGSTESLSADVLKQNSIRIAPTNAGSFTLESSFHADLSRKLSETRVSRISICSLMAEKLRIRSVSCMFHWKE